MIGPLPGRLWNLADLSQGALATSYSSRKRGINLRSEIPQSCRQGAFGSEMRLCICGDGVCMSVRWWS